MFVLLVTVTVLRWISPYTHAKDTKASMYNNPQNSDIQFHSSDLSQVIYAHKSILAASSPVFNEMFYGESSGRGRQRYMSEISEDYDQESIAAFILFIYTDECPKNIETVLNVLQLIKKYQVRSFETSCKNSLEFDKPWPAFKVIEKLLEVEAKEMAEPWWTRIESRIDEVIASEYFLKISQRTLIAFLERETLCYPEIGLFQAVITWSIYQCGLQGMWVTEENQRKVLGDSIFRIRFLSMTVENVKQHVVSSGILTDDEIHAIVETISMRSGHSGTGNYKYIWALPARNHAWYCKYFSVQQLKECAWSICVALICPVMMMFWSYLLSLKEQRQKKEREKHVKEEEAEDEEQQQPKQEQYQKQRQHEQKQKKQEEQPLQHQQNQEPVQQQHHLQHQEYQPHQQHLQHLQHQQQQQQQQQTQKEQEQHKDLKQQQQKLQQKELQQQQRQQQQQQQRQQWQARRRRKRYSSNNINVPD